MDENSQLPAPGSGVSGSLVPGKWIAKLILAVILAEAAWALIVSLTNNLILPLLARAMDADVQSPLYLGKGDINVPALFSSILQFCIAGIVAALLNQWSRRESTAVRVKRVRVVKTVLKPASRPVPAESAQPSPIPAPVQAQQQAAPAQPPPPAPAKPAKPGPPKEIRYNSVGEPINPTEDD